jgi:hypothetical protein
LEFSYDSTGGGMIQVNFAGGDFELKCPAVVLAVLSQGKGIGRNGRSWPCLDPTA